MEILAGIDGGGTKTLVALCTQDGQLLALGRGGPSNVDDVGIDQASNNIYQALQDACIQAKTQVDALSTTFFGMAGVVSQEDRDIVRSIASNLGLHGRLGIDHDCRIALAGALAGREGIVLIAGTGSSCFGRNQHGEVWRSGGWGYLISDEGSSYWLGREALTKTVRALDGRSPTTILQTTLLETLQVHHPDRILHRLYVEGLDRSQVAALAPIVITAAQAGDETAIQLLKQASTLLVECVTAVAKRLKLESSELAVVGGLTKAGNPFWQPFKAALTQKLPLIQLVEPELEPVFGAVICALQADQQLSPMVLQNLKTQAKMIHKERP